MFRFMSNSGLSEAAACKSVNMWSPDGPLLRGFGSWCIRGDAVIRPFQSCPDSVRTRVTDTDFGRGFLGSVPVLQWARHATREQYERLCRYPGSHGWGGVQYDSEFLLLLLSCADFQANLNSALVYLDELGGKSSSCAAIIAPAGARLG